MRYYNMLFIFLLLATACNSVEETDNRIASASILQKKIPLFAGRENKDLMTLRFEVADSEDQVILTEIEVGFVDGNELSGVESVSVYHTTGDSVVINDLAGSFDPGKGVLKTKKHFEPGKHNLSFEVRLKEDPDILTRFQVEQVTLRFSGNTKVAVEPEEEFTYRIAQVIRAAGQDNCDTYRIPGIVTTNSGTLIAVYDNRYNNSKDLQEDIDVGMSRSTDGGQTWEPMKVVMDMGEWGGRSERLNGIGDPAVLYDHTTNTLWVAGLWISGFSEKEMLWWASQPGMQPDETGQFVLVKSQDDGLTWSEPINITEQIKDPAWQLLFQGPGRGITLDDSTLVFPAQFKADIGEKALDGGPYTAHSTIVYSTDKGETWHIGTGAKPNTTEAQVVQLADGSLMLNMRDDLNRRVKDETNGRAVAVSTDMGKTWTLHPSSNSALPEPNCMASIIGTDVQVEGNNQHVLLFSNPDDKHARVKMTIKASFDQGMSWPLESQVLLNEEGGYGYSCLTMVDEDHVGIVYEGVKELYFQKVPINEFLNN